MANFYSNINAAVKSVKKHTEVGTWNHPGLYVIVEVSPEQFDVRRRTSVVSSEKVVFDCESINVAG